MTRPHSVPDDGALDTLRKLEAELEQGDVNQRSNDNRLAAARAEAERILAQAQSSGAESSRQRRRELVDRARTEAATIRGAATRDAEQLTSRIAAQRDDLIAEFLDLVLGPEE
jgi:vacuolar-type H+-ATPase subunit H